MLKKIFREAIRIKTKLRGIIYFPTVYFIRTIIRNIDFSVNNKKINKNKLSILCPSRGRPDKIIRLIKSLNNTTQDMSRIELLVYVDNNDRTIQKYKNKIDKYNINSINEIKVILIIGEPKSISKSWNDLAKNSSGDALMMGNDDSIFETKDWDIIMDDEISKFPDEIYCMWFDDGMRAYMWGDFPIVSRRWYKILGYFTPGCFEFTFNDAWVNDLGKRVGRLHYVKKIKVPHLHIDIGKDKKDETWQKHRVNIKKNVFKRDEILYYSLKSQRIDDAKKLILFKRFFFSRNK